VNEEVRTPLEMPLSWAGTQHAAPLLLTPEIVAGLEAVSRRRISVGAHGRAPLPPPSPQTNLRDERDTGGEP
jgi:hypothetical protein